nr:hypothetical protein [Tanacetum cinerariifolium]
MTGPEPSTPINKTTNKETPSQNTTNQSVIEGHLSALKEVLKEPGNRDLIKPLLLNFNDEDEGTDDEVEEVVKKKKKEKVIATSPKDKGKVVATDDDLSKPFKEVLKCNRVFGSGHRLPTNEKIYDGTGDPKDRITLFTGMGNQGEWPIAGVVLDVSTNTRWEGKGCPELSKRFTNNIPKTVDEMPKRVDDYVRSEEAFRDTELPRGEFQRKEEGVSGCKRMTVYRKVSIAMFAAGRSTALSTVLWEAIHLMRQLEITLESSKLNHMVRDMRQEGKNGPKGNGPQKGKIINMRSLGGGHHGGSRDRKVSGSPDRRGRGGSIKIMGKHEAVRKHKPNGGSVGPPSPSGSAGHHRHNRSAKKNYQAYLQRQFVNHTSRPEEKGVHRRENPSGNPRGGRMAKVWDSQASEIPHVDFKSRVSKEGRRKLEDVDRLQKHKLCMPERLLPLPKIDHKIDSVIGFPLKCFLDAYKGYHQVQMVEEDEKKTAFYTDQVKSKYEQEMMADIPETFDNHMRLNMKLNPKKCLFGFKEEKFLGYMVTSEGIRANPAKTKDIVEMQSPKTWGQMQSLSGKLAALNRFLFRSLHDAERNYAPLEKIALALVYTSRRLRRYFEAHPITVITEQPNKQTLNKAEASGRLAKYSVELGAYNITYEPRSAIKGQILADFINEVPVGSESMVPRTITYIVDHQKDCKEEWVLYSDGSSSAKGSGAGLVLISPTKTEYTCVACQESMIQYPSKAKEYIKCFKNFKFQNIPQYQNQKADVLSKLASVAFNHLTKEILVKVFPLQANYVIRETYMGACSMYLKPQAVVAKAIRQGYYWPTMHRDAWEEIRRCDSCQIHAPVLKLPKTLMTSIMAPWSFFQWGMDVLGPLLEAPEKVKFVIVAVDYFTKWIEAKALAKKALPNTTGKKVKKFVWDNIVCRFGFPSIIVTDNGTNFVNHPFKSWCKQLNIQQINTVVAHPQANGSVERANRSLMEGIKTRLGRERKGWVDELPNVLWAFLTSLRTSNGETPYSLMFGSEVVILAEIGMPTHRTMKIKEGTLNEEEIQLNLDLLQESREAAAIKEARFKTKME